MHKPLTRKQLGDSRDRLLRERAELDSMKKQTVHADGERFDLKVNTPANTDEGIGAESLETDIVVKEHVLEGIARIDFAIRRLENGEYGICIDCNANIPYARLMAFPAAARCLECKEKLETKPNTS